MQQQQQSRLPSLEKKATKKRARGYRQKATRLSINIQACRKSIKNVLGRSFLMEEGVSVPLAVLLEDIAITLLDSAAAHANASGEHVTINSSHLQKAITSNAWMTNTGLLRGRVLGAARSATVSEADERERDQLDKRFEARNKRSRAAQKKREKKKEAPSGHAPRYGEGDEE
jgi:hypothetical protein